jgi:hypothetical protein
MLFGTPQRIRRKRHHALGIGLVQKRGGFRETQDVTHARLSEGVIQEIHRIQVIHRGGAVHVTAAGGSEKTRGGGCRVEQEMYDRFDRLRTKTALSPARSTAPKSSKSPVSAPKYL